MSRGEDDPRCRTGVSEGDQEGSDQPSRISLDVALVAARVLLCP